MIYATLMTFKGKTKEYSATADVFKTRSKLKNRKRVFKHILHNVIGKNEKTINYEEVVEVSITSCFVTDL